MRKWLFLFLVLSAGVSCRNNHSHSETNGKGANEDVHRITVAHAAGFRVTYEGNVKKVEVINPSDPSHPFARYVLVQKGDEYTPSEKETVVYVPLENFASVSTTHIPFITRLGVEKKLTGFAGCKYVKDPVINNLIKDGKISEIGFDYDLDIEKIIDISPEAIMVYPYEGMNFSAIDKAGIKIIYNAEYLENTPLGKTEWIKFVSLFFNKEKEADSVFSAIEKQYREAKQMAAYVNEKPLVLSGKAQQGKWHVPAGKSFAAAFLYDAGADYPWAGTGGNNVLEIDFEEILDKAQSSDWWVITGSCEGKYTLGKLLAEDERYRYFDAFRNKKILFCNVDETDYFGKGVAEPHILLKDLVYYFHGLKEYQPQYFFPLE